MKKAQGQGAVAEVYDPKVQPVCSGNGTTVCDPKVQPVCDPVCQKAMTEEPDVNEGTIYGMRYTGDDMTFFAAVETVLGEMVPHLDAAVWHSGGGIWGVQVSVPHTTLTLFWGAADVSLAADVNDAEGEYLGSILSGVAMEGATAESIAEAIALRSNMWECAQALAENGVGV